MNERGNGPVLLEIPQRRPGFDRFVGCWLCKGDPVVLVDVGPAKSAENLIASLGSLGIERIDIILLTHLHIDHAGAVSYLLTRYPMAKVVCHEKGVEHLVNPLKLWEGSRKVLGPVAEEYGCPGFVPETSIVPHTKFDLEGLRVLETPGHASHHLSFEYRGALFPGEAAGNYLLIGGKEGLRPATPPKLFLPLFLESLDRLLALKDQPICYGHFDRGESSHELLHRFRRQIDLWSRVIREEMSRRDTEGLVGRCFSRLLEEDPYLGLIDLLDAPSRERELFFMESSIKGFIGYFSQK
jgi:glyoxylase-like metal-dependent hydrolase (beta-lactamase superfamily II)